ncbi:hypothetical protein UPYG_G00060510 [Umbra pygmaea]|uniref:Ig-like domain-containing protein n=1 Tax=Umbra pygmaea TaxID=75934 RepID=A0ABD0XU36_UMBPY
MSVRTTGSVLVVFVCCVKMTYTNEKICALKGSTVELSCSYSYSRGHTVRANGWYWKNKNSHWTKIQDTDSGLVLHHGNKKNDCTLRITDVREEHSTSYCFGYTFTTYLGKECSPVTLAVTELQVTRNNWNELICSTTCTLPGNPTYIWYRNGQHIDESTSPQYKDSVYSNYEDSYSCAVKGHEDLHSPVVCVYGQSCSRVIYTKRRICVLKGSSVEISCTYAGYYSVTSSLWFIPKQSGRGRDKLIPKDLSTEPGFVGRVEYPDQESTLYSNPFTLRINNVREEDSAEYRFTFKTHNKFEWGKSLPGTTLTVTDVVLEMDHVTVSEGDRVTLTCRTKCTLDPIPEYIWFKNGQTIENSNNYSTTRIFSVTSEDSGRYSCAVKGHEDIRSTKTNLTVRYAPKNTSVSVSPSGEIVEGSSVTLTCSSDANPPVDKYTWYKKNETSSKASGQSYSITNTRSEDSGEYYCEAENEYGHLNSSLVFVTDLYGPRMPLVSVSPSGEIVEGSSVTLTCSSDANPPVDKYTWYKKNETSPKASGQSYNITNIRSEDTGEYYCEAKNQRASMNSTTLLALAGRQTSVMTRVVVITGVVLVLILCLFGFAWFWINATKITSDTRNTRNTVENGQGESSPVYDNISCTLMDSTAGQTADTDNQDAILYTNIFLSCPGNQDMPLYSTVQLPQHQKKSMDVQYTTLKFNCPSASSRPAAQTTEEDASMIYSTVNKHRGPITWRKEMRP